MFVDLPTCWDTSSYSAQLKGDCAVYRPYQRDCWARTSVFVGTSTGVAGSGSVEGPSVPGTTVGPPPWPDPP
ncbi:hypothetical protein [Curtobacterium sp. MCPF17_052]|uniref:hypothetical protein n=1 Tax=Curtobacterium sp. MCPF17_052 TaxID=2175655 RepID=UPI0024DFF20D|nr:hypothetical protein [Curtobacterium sp. MCPF17_052]WIB12520.1 hypothetical protein DEJ36_18180 [Curtobacterium sp. MCPF17_052]